MGGGGGGGGSGSKNDGEDGRPVSPEGRRMVHKQ